MRPGVIRPARRAVATDPVPTDPVATDPVATYSVELRRPVRVVVVRLTRGVLVGSFVLHGRNSFAHGTRNAFGGAV
jgi:hypothetical protein